MIQRIQSFYLFLVSVLSVVFINVSYLKFHYNISENIVLNISGLWLSGVKAESDLMLNPVPLTAVYLLIILGAITAIFLYRRRKLQIKITLMLIVLSLISIGLLIYYAFLIMSRYKADVVLTFIMTIPLLVLIFSLLAHRAIRNDEELIKSYDRLR